MNDAPRPQIRVGPVHYQILCGAGLLLIFLAQLDQGLMAANLLVVCVGLLGLVSKLRMMPLLLFLTFAGVQIGHHALLYRGNFNVEDIRPLVHVRDLALAIGLIAYLAASYRLQSLAAHILPPDVRQRRDKPHQVGRRWGRQYETVPQKRSAGLLTPQEIAQFVLALPLWAILGQAAWLVVAQPWTLTVFPVRLHRLIAFAWLLIVGAVVVGTILAHWRRRQMDPEAAALYLQDTLWKETRREQRRTFRWLAWRQLHERAER